MNTQTQLPIKVVEQDRRLDKAVASAAEELIRLRWHWTADESNPKRVGLMDYARAVGIAAPTIVRDVKAHEIVSSAANDFDVNEARQRANLPAETQAVTEALAEAHGVKFGTAAKRGNEVRRVRDIARQRAEDKGTSVEEEAPKIAQMVVKMNKADERERAHRARKEGVDLRFIEMEGKLLKAKRALRDALNLAREVEWEDEHQELLADTAAGVRSLLGLIDLALVGDMGVDWDTELANLTVEK